MIQIIRMIRWLLLIILLSSSNCNSSTSDNNSAIRVLLYSETEAYRHANIEVARDRMLRFGKTKGFVMHASEDDNIIHPDSLTEFDVIVFLNTTGDIFNEQQQATFINWYRGGKGFVGIHSASDTEYDWPWYHQLVGGYFVNHPPGTSDAEIEVLDSHHPSTKMLPQPWKINEEWYNMRDVLPETSKLLNLDESTYEGGEMGSQHPLCWYREYDGGRTWYTAIGHKPETFDDTTYLEHLFGGIIYAAGIKD